MTSLPERLRAARLAKGMTLEGTAYAAGVSVATVQRTETGKHSPSLDTLAAIAGAIGVPLADLLADPVEGLIEEAS